MTMLTAFRADLAVCCAVVGALVSAAIMADLAAVSARRSRQGCGLSLLLENSRLLFSKRTDQSYSSDAPLSCCRESFPDSLLSTNAMTSPSDALGPFSIRQSSCMS